MASRHAAQHSTTTLSEQAALPLICVVTADESFLDEITPELPPWYRIVFRQSYDDLVRWIRSAGVSGVILDIDTEGENPHGDLSLLLELRTLNPEFVVVSISRARKKSVSDQAHAAGADAHFRRPVDISELRLALTEVLEARAGEAERKQMGQTAQEIAAIASVPSLRLRVLRRNACLPWIKGSSKPISGSSR